MLLFLLGLVVPVLSEPFMPGVSHEWVNMFTCMYVLFLPQGSWRVEAAAPPAWDPFEVRFVLGHEGFSRLGQTPLSLKFDEEGNSPGKMSRCWARELTLYYQSGSSLGNTSCRNDKDDKKLNEGQSLKRKPGVWCRRLKPWLM
ncbi:hypothetical protein GDO81_020213 [Engystomops pustulosus]|uniref:Uncharacterized protein n=1 Tax=Engystomops pustulosus TaxID=76066 RepID=A0AAV6YXC3_ENGPU|nr:hypothetical protein GDO81_020213 [Engystomops pustulosus]